MDEYGRYILTFGFELLFVLSAYSLIKNTLALKIAGAEVKADRPAVIFIWVTAAIGVLAQIPFFMFLLRDMREFSFSMLSAFTMVIAWILACDCVFARVGDEVVLGFKRYKSGQFTVNSAVKKNYFTHVQLSHPGSDRALLLKTNEALWKEIEPMLK